VEHRCHGSRKILGGGSQISPQKKANRKECGLIWPNPGSEQERRRHAGHFRWRHRQKVTCSSAAPLLHQRIATPHGKRISLMARALQTDRLLLQKLQSCTGKAPWHHPSLPSLPPLFQYHARSHRKSQSRSDAAHPRQALIPAASQALESVGPAGLLRLHEPAVVTLRWRIRNRPGHLPDDAIMKDSTFQQWSHNMLRATSVPRLGSRLGLLSWAALGFLGTVLSEPAKRMPSYECSQLPSSKATPDLEPGFTS
jgi:hypothetical protein